MLVVIPRATTKKITFKRQLKKKKRKEGNENSSLIKYLFDTKESSYGETKGQKHDITHIEKNSKMSGKILIYQ